MPSSDAEHVRRLYQSIYRIAKRIPRGLVATYGQIAELAGIPGGARVAGAAMKTHTAADGAPWYRVVGKAGKNRARIAIHDPVGAAVQRQLLEDEGVTVGDSGLIALDRFGWLPGDGRPSSRSMQSPNKRPTRRPTSTTTAGSSHGASPRRRPRSASKRRASSSRR